MLTETSLVIRHEAPVTRSTTTRSLAHVLVFALVLVGSAACNERRVGFADTPQPSASPGVVTPVPGNEPFPLPSTGPALPNTSPSASPDPSSSPSPSPDLPSSGGLPTATPSTIPSAIPSAIPSVVPQPATGSLDVNGQTVRMNALTITIPTGWALHQEATSDGVMLVGFARGTDYVRFYAKQGTGLNMQTIFVNGSQATAERQEQAGGRTWRRLDATRGAVQISAFLVEANGWTYYGYARAASPAAAATELLNATK